MKKLICLLLCLVAQSVSAQIVTPPYTDFTRPPRTINDMFYTGKGSHCGWTQEAFGVDDSDSAVVNATTDHEGELSFNRQRMWFWDANGFQSDPYYGGDLILNQFGKGIRWHRISGKISLDDEYHSLSLFGGQGANYGGGIELYGTYATGQEGSVHLIGSGHVYGAILIDPQGVNAWAFTSSAFIQNGTNGTPIEFQKGGPVLISNDVSGRWIGTSNSKSTAIYSGPTYTDGAYTEMYGNTATGQEGILHLGGGSASGNISQGAVNIEPRGALSFSFNGDGSFRSYSTNIGWVAASHANQACNTTCGTNKGCVFGYDQATNTLVACGNAAADTCICTQS